MKLKLDGRVECVSLNKQKLEQFETQENRRDIRSGVVGSLVALLRKGNHFETPIMVNKVNGKYRLLDGNHRFEALTKYFEDNPKAEIEIFMYIYEDLTPAQEREQYTKWNSGTKQNTNDFLKQYWNTIPVVKLIEKDETFPYPISYNWSEKNISFHFLGEAYLNAKLSMHYRGGALVFLKKVKDMGHDDYKLMRAFLKDYMMVFGTPNKKNMYYKKTIFTAMFKIWMDNVNKVSYTVMENAFRRVFGHPKVLYYNALGGSREIVIMCYKDLLGVINGHRKVNVFEGGVV